MTTLHIVSVAVQHVIISQRLSLSGYLSAVISQRLSLSGYLSTVISQRLCLNGYLSVVISQLLSLSGHPSTRCSKEVTGTVSLRYYLCSSETSSLKHNMTENS